MIEMVFGRSYAEEKAFIQGEAIALDGSWGKEGLNILLASTHRGGGGLPSLQDIMA